MSLTKKSEKHVPNKEDWNALMVELQLNDSEGNNVDSEWFTFSKKQINNGRWKEHVENYFGEKPNNNLL